jgi:hypothetical protein
MIIPSLVQKYISIQLNLGYGIQGVLFTLTFQFKIINTGPLVTSTFKMSSAFTKMAL